MKCNSVTLYDFLYQSSGMINSYLFIVNWLKLKLSDDYKCARALNNDLIVLVGPSLQHY